MSVLNLLSLLLSVLANVAEEGLECGDLCDLREITDFSEHQSRFSSISASLFSSP